MRPRTRVPNSKNFDGTRSDHALPRTQRACRDLADFLQAHLSQIPPDDQPEATRLLSAARDTIPATIHPPGPRCRFSPEKVIQMYKQTGSVAKAAQFFGVSRQTIYRYLAKCKTA